MSKTVPQDVDYPIDTDNEQASVSVDAEVDLNNDAMWVDLAASNYKTAKNYQEAALSSQWERNADHFNSRHYRRSIYNSKQFKGRSRLFRPLTRAAERSSSASLASALFSNVNIVKVNPNNHNDPMQVASAQIMEQIVAYRLEKTIPWYLTALGAWQDTRVYGPCCTYTSWNYQEREVTRVVKTPVLDVMGMEIDGRFDETETKDVEVVVDEPVIEMIPPENLFLDPECDWRDPISSSPYVIRLKPMHLDDILARMESEDDKTSNQQWITHSKEAILSVAGDEYNQVTQSREGDERPSKSDSQERDEFKVIWVHENFVRLQGEEYVYWTLGSRLLLTEPTPLADVYHTGKRPLTYGFSIIEAHRFSPSSPTELIAGLQTGVNDIANLRFDNVKLALNKRYIIRRGAAVDLESLMRSVPGGGIVTDDPERDIKVIDTRDVTGSSYREQERLETESNDLSGTFMGGAVQNNRAMNETVGGMEMMNEGASAISEFDIRTFIESWVKPQLELLIQYIQAYETDDVIFHNSFDEAFKKLGYKYESNGSVTQQGEEKFSQADVASIKDTVLNQKLTITVNVGLGATSPQKRIDMLTHVMKSLEAMPEQLQRLDGDEIVKEIFAAAGFQDGERFIKGGKPGEEEKPEITEEQLEEARQQGIQEGTDAAKMANVQMLDKIGTAKIASLEKQTTETNQTKIQVAQIEKQHREAIEGRKNQSFRDSEAVKSKDRKEELNFKERTGKPGI